MDKIVIRDLEVNYRVGVPDEERESPQRLLISWDLWLDFSKAATSDDVGGTIDYGRVCDRFRRFGVGRSWKLIETLAVDIAETTLGEFNPVKVRVEVKKFILKDTRYVSVEAERANPVVIL